MEFYDPVVAQEELPKTNSANDENKTEETVLKLENEIDKVYTTVENKFQDLWQSASENANNLKEDYKLEEHRTQLINQLNAAKENINNKAKFTENLSQIEEQLKKLHIPDIDLMNLQGHANTALDSLDATLEQVEKQAGKYVSQFASFFSNIVSINPSAEQQTQAERKETLFTSPLNDHENYGTSRYDNDLYKLHTTSSFYISDELDNPDELAKFNADSKTDEISKLLDSYPSTLTKLMNEMVPVKISYKLFWYRYFLNDLKIKESEQKRKKLLERKEKSNNANGDEDEEEDAFIWDDEDEDDEDVVDVAKEALVDDRKPKTDEDDEDDDWE